MRELNFPLQIMLDIDTVNMIQHFVDSGVSIDW